ncbi:MAG TPA: VOC family protein [Permianibacter sp.]|nr:VOC family protein [Permianibacter sp.]
MTAQPTTASPFSALMTAAYPIAAERLAEARDWYSRLLGSAPYFDQPFYVGFNVAGYELGLVPKADGEAPTQTTGAVPFWGTPDANAVYQRLLNLGADSIEAPHDVGDGIVVAQVRDPFGNLFGVIQNPHFPHTGG